LINKLNNKTYIAIDLFSGCGGLSEGMKQAGFKVLVGIENDPYATDCYSVNHPETVLFNKDIKKLKIREIKKLLNGKTLDLLAGCPPCQGFSSIRRLNRKRSVRDKRNNLIKEFHRFVKKLRPLTIMLENVPALKNYRLFKKIVKKLRRLDYSIEYKVVDIKHYGVPQRRKRLIMVGSKLGKIPIAPGIGEEKTVADAMKNLESVEKTNDPVHKIVARHNDRIKEMIEKIPKDGGSRTDLPEEDQLECHKKSNVGFNDVYGRLKWDDYSSTITGGCLNPSKGRFLHPEENRCITAREAALLQTFPRDYKFPTNIPKTVLASLIGNALPPEFSRIQSLNILNHIKNHVHD